MIARSVQVCKITGKKIWALDPNIKSQKPLQQQHSNTEKTGQSQYKLQILLHMAMPYSQRQFFTNHDELDLCGDEKKVVNKKLY